MRGAVTINNGRKQQSMQQRAGVRDIGDRQLKEEC